MVAYKICSDSITQYTLLLAVQMARNLWNYKCYGDGHKFNANRTYRVREWCDSGGGKDDVNTNKQEHDIRSACRDYGAHPQRTHTVVSRESQDASARAVHLLYCCGAEHCTPPMTNRWWLRKTVWWQAYTLSKQFDVSLGIGLYPTWMLEYALRGITTMMVHTTNAVVLYFIRSQALKSVTRFVRDSE